MSEPERMGWISRVRERGVLRVAASYAVIAWLALQIADVTLDPLGAPKWVLTALIIAAAVGFPVAITLAWFLEIGEHGRRRGRAAPDSARPASLRRRNRNWTSARCSGRSARPAIRPRQAPAAGESGDCSATLREPGRRSGTGVLELPWFKALDGYPPYEKLKREREDRIERIRPVLLQIETESGLARGPRALQSPVGSG